MGESNRKLDMMKDKRIIKFNLISKKIIPSDEEFNMILLEELKYLNEKMEKTLNDLNEMRGKI